MIPATETVILTEGKGRIELRGNPYAFGLFVDDTPVVLNWCDCDGSIGQQFYLFDADLLEERITALHALVEKGPRMDESLAGDLMPLLCQFPSGEYVVEYGDIDRPYQFPEWDINEVREWPDGVSYAWYYPDATNFLPTQPYHRLNEERIIHYMLEIEQGKRPVAITTTIRGAWGEFILDGHHKLCAYSQLRISPRRICIEASEARLPTLDWPVQIKTPPAFLQSQSVWKQRPK